MSTTHTPAPWHCSALRHVPMLSAYTYDRDDRPVALPVTDANAALIAAAPDLLAALQQCLRYGGLYPDLAEDVRAAITRATGA